MFHDAAREQKMQAITKKLEHMAVILLAAGQARRFGGHKLSTEVAGRPLAFHAAQTFGQIPFARHFIVSGSQTPDIRCFGFEHVELSPEPAPISQSIALGIKAVAATHAQAALIALADMPLISRNHVLRLVDRFDGNRIASAHGSRRMPPAIFGRELFDALITLSGDHGGNALLGNAPVVVMKDVEAIDVDDPADLAVVEKLLVGRQED